MKIEEFLNEYKIALQKLDLFIKKRYAIATIKGADEESGQREEFIDLHAELFGSRENIETILQETNDETLTAEYMNDIHPFVTQLEEYFENILHKTLHLSEAKKYDVGIEDMLNRLCGQSILIKLSNPNFNLSIENLLANKKLLSADISGCSSDELASTLNLQSYPQDQEFSVTEGIERDVNMIKSLIEFLDNLNFKKQEILNSLEQAARNMPWENNLLYFKAEEVSVSLDLSLCTDRMQQYRSKVKNAKDNLEILNSELEEGSHSTNLEELTAKLNITLSPDQQNASFFTSPEFNLRDMIEKISLTNAIVTAIENCQKILSSPANESFIVARKKLKDVQDSKYLLSNEKNIRIKELLETKLKNYIKFVSDFSIQFFPPPEKVEGENLSTLAKVMYSFNCLKFLYERGEISFPENLETRKVYEIKDVKAMIVKHIIEPLKSGEISVDSLGISSPAEDYKFPTEGYESPESAELARLDKLNNWDDWNMLAIGQEGLEIFI